jgi:hypothetical protein
VVHIFLFLLTSVHKVTVPCIVDLRVHGCYSVIAYLLIMYVFYGEGTPRKLATATQPQFPRIVVRLEHMLLNGATQIEETAT